MRNLLFKLVVLGLLILLFSSAWSFLTQEWVDSPQPNGYIVAVGAILSVVARWAPGIGRKFAALDDDKKQLVMLALLFLTVGVRYGLSCVGQDAIYPCTGQGIYQAFVDFIMALMSNVGTYRATKYIGAK